MMYWAPAVAMETAVPSYLSLEHKQALASNVIPVNMRESDERGSDPSLPSHTLDGFLCGLLGLCWMLWTNMVWVGALLGHIPGEGNGCYCFCLFITSPCFDGGLRLGKKRTWSSCFPPVPGNMRPFSRGLELFAGGSMRLGDVQRN